MRTHPLSRGAGLALCLTTAAALPAAAQSLWYHLPGQGAGDIFGSVVQAAGDVNADGFEDFLAGGSQALSSGPGYLHVFDGRTGNVLRTHHGDAQGDLFGTAAAGLGDLNGDGFGEIAVGAHLASPAGGPSRAGLVRVFSGVDGSVLFEVPGLSADDHFGWSVAAAGDVDLDGVPDLIAGAIDASPSGASSGRARVVSGATGLDLHVFGGQTTADFLGWSVAGLGDVDGDGHADVAAGAPGPAGSGAHTGWVRAWSGQTGVELFTVVGTTAKDVFGAAIAPTADLNGDLVPDLLVGAPQRSTPAAGYVRALSGADGAVLWTVVGDQLGDVLGASVAGLGDVDGDGVSDVATGAPRNDDNGTSSGLVAFLSGADGSRLGTMRGAAAGLFFGTTLGSGFDVNGDGIVELAIGQTGDSTSGFNAGSVRVYSSETLPFTGSAHVISVAGGSTTTTLDIDAGPALGGLRYRVLGSLRGTLPGTTMRGVLLPLQPDRYFDHLASAPFARPVVGARGRLDAQGRATADFLPPPSMALVGDTFFHAVLIVDDSGQPVLATNAVPLTLAP